MPPTQTKRIATAHVTGVKPEIYGVSTMSAPVTDE